MRHMLTWLLRTLAPALLMTCAANSSAQTVAVNHIDSDDEVGIRIAYELREAISRSSRLKLGSSSATDGFEIVLLSSDISDISGVRRGSISTYSYTLIIKDGNGGFNYFVGTNLGTCGLNRASSCAAGIVADTDQWLQLIRDLVDNPL